MSTPFETWPAGYGPGHGFSGGAGGNRGGGDEPPPYDDEDAPPPEDEGQPSADPSTGEVVDGGSVPESGRKGKPSQDQRQLFLDWAEKQLSRVEAYGQPIRKRAAWCPEWWKHPEVVERLYVSWKAYLQATKRMAEDGMSQSSWWVQHWDHHARIIFDKEQGPFRACNAAGHLADNDGAPLTLTLQMPPADVTLF